jgi:hypothetical protein
MYIKKKFTIESKINKTNHDFKKFSSLILFHPFFNMPPIRERILHLLRNIIKIHHPQMKTTLKICLLKVTNHYQWSIKNVANELLV